MRSNTQAKVHTVVFDLGNVLIKWDPRALYRKIFADDNAAMEHFLTEVCNAEWNERQDCGRPWKDGIALAIKQHPSHEANIRAYHERWEEMIPGAIDETVEILAQLRALGIRLLALTNWSHETFPIALRRFSFLEWFEGIVVSGRELLVKPDPAIFKLLIDRYQLDPASTVFIDDSMRNVEAAVVEGLHGIHFQSAGDLRLRLQDLGIPLPPA
ncbi:Phosphorylated carbohydrates phosphatase TM_1254 [Massilia sp. Bi118]|uniref:HAD family hydrolase n=1 Tax=Massilia sp. Bi118 TaxID=2822346 RepID=UPI001D5C78A0|nr:HAD family phosphatase [Massilia sp. Bi118]CAH0194361.1 Phosphorylated carbohydrates phosphatase TM_1254 [Massilia sp. Bi118]